MNIEIPYGKTKILIDVPDRNLERIITDNTAFKKTDESLLIKKVLSNPVKSRNLSELAKGKESAVVLVSDITRPVPSYKFMPYIIDELNSGGLKDIKIIFGLGIHRQQTDEERVRLVGSYVAGKARLVDSNKSRCRSLGKTSYGTQVEIFEEALDSDLLICTGNIEYHYFAGYSGGAKAVMPGISSYAAIANNHSYMLNDNACSGNFKTNPVRTDIEEAGRMTGIDFIFNVILDDNKTIIDAVAGSNNQAFIEGIKKYDSLFRKEVENQSDIVITSPGGYPKDINLYQSHKAIENAKELVKPGGYLLLVAKCEENFGENTFEEWMYDARDYDSLRKRIEEKFTLGGHKAVAISKILSGVKACLFSDFNTQTTRKIGFKKIRDLQEFINKRISENKDTKITVVPSGRLVKLKRN